MMHFPPAVSFLCVRVCACHRSELTPYIDGTALRRQIYDVVVTWCTVARACFVNLRPVNFRFRSLTHNVTCRNYSGPTCAPEMTPLTVCVLSRLVLQLLLLSAGASGVNPAGKETFLDYYMLEELPPRSLVGNLVRDYGLDHQYRPAVLASLRFTMLTQSQLERSNFEVDKLTGDIHLTSRRLDRESICPRQDECIVQFDVAVQPIQYFQIIKVTTLTFLSNAVISKLHKICNDCGWFLDVERLISR